MARTRTIKPKFFDDIKIGRISRDARLLYIGLWVFADDSGVVVGDTVWLRSRIFPYDQIQSQQFGRWLEELVRNGFIYLLSYNGERFIYLPKFTRHQAINRPNLDDLNIPKDLLPSVLAQITEQSLNNHGTITEHSVNNHGTISEQSVSNHSEEENTPDGFPPHPLSLTLKEEKENTPNGVKEKPAEADFAVGEGKQPYRGRDPACVQDNAPPPTPSPRPGQFKPPSVDEVAEYIRQRGYGGIDPEAFVAFYESKGWKVGRNPMKNWKAAVVTWSKRREDERRKPPDRTPRREPDANDYWR